MTQKKQLSRSEMRNISGGIRVENSCGVGLVYATCSTTISVPNADPGSFGHHNYTQVVSGCMPESEARDKGCVIGGAGGPQPIAD